MRISFDEAMKGCTKNIEMPVKEQCGTCHGSGARPGSNPETCSKCGGKGQVRMTHQTLFGTMQNISTCPDCNGTGKIVRDKCPDCRGEGYISRKKKLEVNIPAGIDNGQQVRLRDLGEPGRNGGERGDLLVEVIISSHPTLHRQDMNIFSEVELTYAQAALGSTIRILTIDGEVEYEVKPGTQTDTRIRLRGKGVPSLRNPNMRGDHYVTLMVKTPTGLSGEAKELLRQFDQLTGNSLKSADEAGKRNGFFGKKK